MNWGFDSLSQAHTILIIACYFIQYVV